MTRIKPVLIGLAGLVAAVPVGALAAGGGVPATPPAAGGGAPIEVVVTNVRSAEGRVRAEICTEQEFLGPCRIGVEVPAKAGTTIVVIPDVPPGRYASVAYHDRNGNGKADRNFIGIPTEDVGFSNNALKGLVKPKWADAAFDHGAARQRITFALKAF